MAIRRAATLPSVRVETTDGRVHEYANATFDGDGHQLIVLRDGGVVDAFAYEAIAVAMRTDSVRTVR